MRRLRETTRPQRSRLTLVVAGAVLVGSLLPDPSVALTASTLQQVSVSALLQSLSPTNGVAFGPDKLLHTVGYAALAGCLVSTWERRPRLRGVVAVVVLASMFGAGIEVAQAFVPGRTASGGDLLANTVGATLGAVVAVDRVDWWRTERDDGATTAGR